MPDSNKPAEWEFKDLIINLIKIKQVCVMQTRPIDDTDLQKTDDNIEWIKSRIANDSQEPIKEVEKIPD